jgi:hypothetical protein
MQTSSYPRIQERYNSTHGLLRFVKIQKHWTNVNLLFGSLSILMTNTSKDYDRAARMLQPTPYPSTYPTLKKLELLEKQAKILGQLKNFSRPPQTTSFHNGLNTAGVEMKMSTGSGQDCTGINDRSKNSVLVTYLADAWNWGTEIFCSCEVRYIEEDRERGGYIVFFAWLGNGRERFEDDVMSKLMWVRAVCCSLHVAFTSDGC